MTTTGLTEDFYDPTKNEPLDVEDQMIVDNAFTFNDGSVNYDDDAEVDMSLETEEDDE